MSNEKTKNHPACLGIMVCALLLSSGFIQAQDNRPTEIISQPGLLGEGGCDPEVVPASCSVGNPICSDPDRDPWYILESALKVSHEAKGPNPKIEYFSLQHVSIVDAGDALRAEASPTGRIAQDMAGRWLHLPGINTWDPRHEISEGWEPGMGEGPRRHELRLVLLQKP